MITTSIRNTMVVSSVWRYRRYWELLDPQARAAAQQQLGPPRLRYKKYWRYLDPRARQTVVEVANMPGLASPPGCDLQVTADGGVTLSRWDQQHQLDCRFMLVPSGRGGWGTPWATGSMHFGSLPHAVQICAEMRVPASAKHCWDHACSPA